MPKPLLLNQYHLTFETPATLTKAELARARRAVHSLRLRRRLEQALRATVARFPSLSSVRVRLTD